MTFFQDIRESSVCAYCNENIVAGQSFTMSEMDTSYDMDWSECEVKPVHVTCCSFVGGKIFIFGDVKITAWATDLDVFGLTLDEWWELPFAGYDANGDEVHRLQ